MRLILGSTSARRHMLMLEAGAKVELASPDINETEHPHEPADVYVGRMSREKAHAVQQQLPLHTHALILTADTTVADGPQILGKPANSAEAKRMLIQLRHRSHMVHSGVSLLNTVNDELHTIIVSTEVVMRDYSDAEIDDYIESGDPFGKAGSYAIQNTTFYPVAELKGCYLNVVGLPMCVVCELLARQGVHLAGAVPCSPTNLPCVGRLQGRA